MFGLSVALIVFTSVNMLILFYVECIDISSIRNHINTDKDYELFGNICRIQDGFKDPFVKFGTYAFLLTPGIIGVYMLNF